MLKLADAILALGADNKALKGDLAKAESTTKGWASNVAGTIKGALGGAIIGGAVAAAGAVVAIGASAFNVSNDVRKAARDMEASLGVLPEEAERFAEVAKRVYGNNFAASVDDAGKAVAEVVRQLNLAADDPALQKVTENAFALRDSFGVETAESISAVKSLMENFGISADEAFNFVASGFQRGLDRSGDFLDTINEYSTQFANGGASAAQFFSLLQTGLQGGNLGTDKAADAFKEFRLRIQDGSKTTADGLALLGLNSEELTAKLATGAIDVADAFEIVVSALNRTEDPTIRMQAGAALLGTQFEDLGDEAVRALSLTAVSMNDLAGASDILNRKYDNFGDFFTGIWRRAVVAITPATAALLEMANSVLPNVEAAFGAVEGAIKRAFEQSAQIGQAVLDATGDQLTANLARLATLTGGTVTYDAKAQIATVDWGEGLYTHTYDAKAEITEDGVLWGAWSHKYDAQAEVTETSVLWGLYSHTYDASAKIDTGSILWGIASHTYDAKAQVNEDSVLWGTISHTYDASAKVEESNVLWGLWTNTYSAQVDILDVLWGLFDHEYEASAKVGESSVLWGLWTFTYDVNGKIIDVEFARDLKAPTIPVSAKVDKFLQSEEGQDLNFIERFVVSNGGPQIFEAVIQAVARNAILSAPGTSPFLSAPAPVPNIASDFTWPELPDFSQLFAFTWPDLSATAAELLVNLFGFAWPELPADLGELLDWAWPDFEGQLASLWAGILAWSWPDFSASIRGTIDDLLSFAWPKLDKPAWIDGLLSFNIPTPSWVTALLNWTPSLPSLPSWLGGGGNTEGSNTDKVNGFVGPSAVPQSTGKMVTISIGPVYVSNQVDMELLASTVAQRLAYG